MSKKAVKTISDLARESFNSEQYNFLINHPDLYQPDEDLQQYLANLSRVLIDHNLVTPSTKDKIIKAAMYSKAPTLDDFANAAGVVGNDSLKAGDEFLRRYFDKSTPKAEKNAWYWGIEGKYGEGAWNRAKKSVQQRELSNMEKAILEGRAKAVAEGSSGIFGFLNRTLNPTAYKEAVFQSLNDVPMDESRVRNAAIADFGANALEAGAVGLNPMVAIPTIMGVETGRQMLANQVFGHKTKPEEIASMAIGAGLAGGTTPAAMTGLGSFFSKVPGMRDLGRGLVKGARGYKTDYAQQLDDLTRDVLELRKLKSQDASKMGAAQLDHMQNLEDDVVLKLKTIGVTPDNSLLDNMAENVANNTLAKEPSTFTIADLIGTGEKLTDKQVKKELKAVYGNKRDWNYDPNAEEFARTRDWKASDQYKVLKELKETNPGLFQSLVFGNSNPRKHLNAYTRSRGVEPYVRPETIVPTAADIAEAERASQASKEIGSQLRTLFPAKYAKDAGRSENWLQRNLDIGSVLAGGTGAMETTMRVNPLDVPSAIAEGTIDKLRDYRDSKWFKDLKKDKPKLAKAFEAVFKGRE
jgi:hypothetical protein